MKKLLTLFLLLVISHAIFSQEKVTVIDFEKVINNSQVKLEFDYIYNKIDSFVMRLGREQIAIYQENMQEVMIRYQGGCMTHEEMKKMEEVLKNQERKILSLDKFIIDTLPFFRQKLNYEVRKIIQKEIEEYATFSGIKFIGDSNTLYFHISAIKDISYRIDFQLKQKYNLPHRKLARKQIIYQIKEKYNLNQDLKNRFNYAILNQNSR